MRDNIKVAYRQGEILIFKIDSEHALKMRDRDVIKPHKDNVIREGETSGHMHAVEGGQLFDGLDQINNWQFPDIPAGDMLLEVKDKATITHPEHKAIKLEKGDYVVRIQREYDEENRFRNVAD